MRSTYGSGVGRALFAARGAFGVTAIAAPRVILRLLGLRPGDNADYAYVLRLWGTREAFVAVMSAGVGGSPASAVTALRLGMAVDTVDIISLLLAYRSGRPRPAAATLLAAAGLGAVGMGYLAAVDARRNNHVGPRGLSVGRTGATNSTC